MKKSFSIVLVLIFLLGLIGCSNKEKVPTISEVSQMKYSEVNAVLFGKDIQEIRDAWDAPAESDGRKDIWQLDESMVLMITYNDTGIIESCELICGTPLAPTGAIESTEANTRKLDLKSLETACAEGFIDPAKVTVLGGEWAYTAEPDEFVVLATVRYTTKDDEYETADFLIRGVFEGKIELYHCLNGHSPYTRENALQEFGAIDNQRFPLE